MDRALEALAERHPRPADRAAAVPVRDRIEAFPPLAQTRLLALRRDVEEGGGSWTRRTRPASPPVTRPKQRLSSVLGMIVFWVVLAVLLLAMGIGIVTMLDWVVLDV